MYVIKMRISIEAIHLYPLLRWIEWNNQGVRATSFIYFIYDFYFRNGPLEWFNQPFLKVEMQ